MDTQATRPRYRFGEYELEGEAGELRRNGSPLKLQPQPFKLLLLLVRRSGTSSPAKRSVRSSGPTALTWTSIRRSISV